jgi:hypothetical protein
VQWAKTTTAIVEVLRVGMTITIKNESPKKDLVAQVEAITKMSLALTALCYTLGVIVVNLHFAQYGYYSLELFRLSYIVAGVWFFLILGTWVLLFALFLVRSKAVVQSERSKWKKAVLLGFTVFMMVSVIYMLWVVGTHLGIAIDRSWAGVLCLGIFGSGVLLYEFSDILRKPLVAIDPVEKVYNVAFGVLLLVIYTVSFAQVTYSRIPASLGGGGAQLVRVTATEDARLALEGAGISFSEVLSKRGENVVSISDTLGLVFMGEKDIVVVSPKIPERSFLINRDALLFVQFLKKH